jgi:hypothetical protein
VSVSMLESRRADWVLWTLLTGARKSGTSAGSLFCVHDTRYEVFVTEGHTFKLISSANLTERMRERRAASKASGRSERKVHTSQGIIYPIRITVRVVVNIGQIGWKENT